MTPGEIRALLEKYDIGAQPLSNLLGWGANTIDRQIRHTIPDREHTRRLRELNDPADVYKRQVLPSVSMNTGRGNCAASVDLPMPSGP